VEFAALPANEPVVKVSASVESDLIRTMAADVNAMLNEREAQ
jgi:hypothetical protein